MIHHDRILMEHGGVSAPYELRGRPCIEYGSVFGLSFPPPTGCPGYFCRIRFSIGLAFRRCPVRPRSAPPSWFFHFPYSLQGPPLTSPGPPDPIFGIRIAF